MGAERQYSEARSRARASERRPKQKARVYVVHTPHEFTRFQTDFRDDSACGIVLQVSEARGHAAAKRELTPFRGLTTEACQSATRVAIQRANASLPICARVSNGGDGRVALTACQRFLTWRLHSAA